MKALSRYLVVTLFLLLTAVRLGRLQISDCPMVQPSDLGGIGAPSTGGLISDAIRAQSQPVDPITVQVFNSTFVCIAQGTLRNTARMVSVLVRYTRTGESTVRTEQFQWQCINGRWGANVLGSQTFLITDPPAATFDTPLRQDCSHCADPAQPTGLNTNNFQHCNRKFLH